MTQQEYKALSIREFSKAARVYETDDAGVYRMCKKDYPDVLAELEREPFTDLLDCGCGTAPMLTLLKQRYPDRHYTGIDLTPEMIEVGRAKRMPGVKLVVGDCEKLPFPELSQRAGFLRQRRPGAASRRAADPAGHDREVRAGALVLQPRRDAPRQPRGPRGRARLRRRGGPGALRQSRSRPGARRKAGLLPTPLRRPETCEGIARMNRRSFISGRDVLRR